MRKWWRKFKNKKGWDFTKDRIGLFFYKMGWVWYNNSAQEWKSHERIMVSSPNGCYSYTCNYCGHVLKFKWEHTLLAFHNMQRHIKAKHIDVL